MDEADTTSLVSTSPTQGQSCSSESEYALRPEIMKLVECLGRLDLLVSDAQINPDGKWEDETDIYGILREAGEAYYALHNAAFALIPWNTERRRKRLNPGLSSGVRRHMPRPEVDLEEVKRALGI